MSAQAEKMLLQRGRNLPADPAPSWRPLRILNTYRLGISSLFLYLSSGGHPPPPFGESDPRLFLLGSVGYLIFGLVSLLAAEGKILPIKFQRYTQLTADIVATTLLMHASGGVVGGLGVLLIVVVANAAMITAGRTAVLFAALASISVLLEQAYSHFRATEAISNYPHAGMLGIALFATAALAHVMARRAQESQALAVQRGIDLANLSELASYAIQHMQTGVLAVDHERRLLFANTAATRLLGIEGASKQESLDQVSRDLAARLTDWYRTGANPSPLQLRDVEHEIIPRFMAVGGGRVGVLIFLEDASLASRQVQQLKLASLGHLTASIAHEIRNPLSAINHAGELLRESQDLSPVDQRLAEIIITQARRVNGIIENILQLGRRDLSSKTTFLLCEFLAEMAAHCEALYKLTDGELAIEQCPKDLEITFDKSHLTQIVENLCVNAVRYTRGCDTRPLITVSAGFNKSGRPYLDIRDTGPGIPEKDIDKIFEPFFTTAHDGTGLGLYISKELAHCNQGELLYIPTPIGCLFRILFPEGRSGAPL